MKHLIQFLFSIFFIFLCLPSTAVSAKSTSDNLKLTDQEVKWIEENNDRTFIVGLTPQSGFDYFIDDGEAKGYIKPLLTKMSQDLGIKFVLKVSKNWDEIYKNLQNGEIDIIYGANKTEQREQFMAFTKPVLKIPYAVISKKDGPVHNIGDLDNRRVGFMKNDFVIDALTKVYKNVYFHTKTYLSKEDGITALTNELIDAYITVWGPDIYEYIYKYPELAYSFKISSITSDVTFSSRKSNSIIMDIIEKEISYLNLDYIPEVINKAETDYTLKIINFTEEERKWLREDGRAIVGVTKDYIPFDYYENGQYKGIGASILKEIAKTTGIKLEYRYGDFNDLEDSLKAKEINILSMSKTEKRQDYVIFTEPFNKERNIIIGRKDQKDARDIYGLEGKRVAVIKGFWYYDALVKSLSNVKIIETNSIEESMRLVREGKADYLIENPTVAKYYMEELQYNDLVQRGSTSTQSFLYFGVSKNKPELAGIINKVIPIIDIDELSRKGYEEVPHKDNIKSYQRLIAIIAVLLLFLILILVFLVRLIKRMVDMKTEQELLKQREYLLSIDTLTELHNRNYLSTKVLVNIDSLSYPQVVIAADVNNLKTINDTYGHAAGDVLLKTFAEALKEACPGNSHIFRVGGDEFLIIITDSSEAQAAETIENIKKATVTRKITFCNNEEFVLTAAFGYAIRFSENITFDELYKAADMDMYSHKRSMKAILDRKVLFREKER